ncbi:Hypothetical predicted protein, partial [Paramuricea clavata]
MSDWRQFKVKQPEKRMAKPWTEKGKGESKDLKDEIIVQRMSSEVTGKQQKYTRIGPQ